jgi:hypothetical protein
MEKKVAAVSDSSTKAFMLSKLLEDKCDVLQVAVDGVQYLHMLSHSLDLCVCFFFVNQSSSQPVTVTAIILTNQYQRESSSSKNGLAMVMDKLGLKMDKDGYPVNDDGENDGKPLFPTTFLLKAELAKRDRAIQGLKDNKAEREEVGECGVMRGWK